MKRYFLPAIALLTLLFPAAASAQLNTFQGGTGTTSPSGILYGITGNLHLQTVGIGAGCTFSIGILSCAGTGGSFPFTPTSYGVSTSTTIGLLNGFISTASSTQIGNFTFASSNVNINTDPSTQNAAPLTILQQTDANNGGFILVNKEENASARWWVDSSQVQHIDNGSSANLPISLNGGGTGFVGIATSTPGSLLSIQGITNFTIATSTFYSSGGIVLTSGCISYSVNGPCITQNSGTVTSITASSPLTGGTITTSGSIGIQAASASQNGYLASTDYSLLHTATSTFSAPLVYTTSTNAVTCPTCTTGGVTSVSGTTNQITSSGGTTPTLSLPSLVIFPGNIEAFASSTVGNGTALGGLTIAGGATTTLLSLLQSGFLSLASSTVVGNFTDTGNLLSNGTGYFGSYVGIENTPNSSWALNLGSMPIQLGIIDTPDNTSEVIETDWGWNIHGNSTHLTQLPDNSFMVGYPAGYPNGSTFATNDIFDLGAISIASTTPFGELTVADTPADPFTEAFLVSSSTATATTTLFSVTNAGHIIASSTNPVISACGTGPTMTGDDSHGTVTEGSSASSGCVLTFKVPYTVAPPCVVTTQTGSISVAFTYAVTATAITVTDSALSSDKWNYICIGTAGS